MLSSTRLIQTTINPLARASIRLSFHTSTIKMTAGPKLDLLHEVKIDHDNIRDLRARFDQAHQSGDKNSLGAIANTALKLASVHSDAEELSIYKAFDKHDMHALAESDRSDHHKVKQAFSEVDKAIGGLTSPDIDTLVKHVREASDLFLHHAKEEEEKHLPQLISKLSDQEQQDLTREFLQARKKAPERAHPSAPQGGGIGQAAAAMASKPVDAMIQAWREEVPLKYQHAEV